MRADWNIESGELSGESEQDRETLILELAGLYVLNLLKIADAEDEGGLDHPLESKHECLQPMIDKLQSENLIGIEDYDDEEGKGQEYVPTSAAQSYFQNLEKKSRSYRNMSSLPTGLEAVRRAFYLAMGDGELNRIDESRNPWYHEICRFDF